MMIAFNLIKMSSFIGFSDGDSDDESWGPHQLGVVVPYRDRFEELLEFVPHMHSYLNAKKVKHKIFIVCLLYTSPSPRDGLLSRMPSSA